MIAYSCDSTETSHTSTNNQHFARWNLMLIQACVPRMTMRPTLLHDSDKLVVGVYSREENEIYPAAVT